MVGLDVRRVHDQEVVVLAAAVGDQVVGDPAALVREQRVLRLRGSDPAEVVREPCLQVVGRTVAVEHELAHVRDVEDARGGANRLVLLDDRRVLHRHLPAGEGDDAGAELGVSLVERRAAERLHERDPNRLRRLEPGCEMPQHGRLGDELVGGNRLRLLEDLRHRVGGVLELARGVRAPRNREPQELEARMPVLPRRRIAAGHDRADLGAAHAAREVERARERPAGEAGRRDVRQRLAGVQVDGVAAGRLDDRGTGRGERLAEVGDLGDAVAQVLLVHHLVEADRDHLEVAPGEAAVGREALGHDAAHLEAGEELLVVADGDEAADVRDRVLLRAHEDAVGVGHHLAHDLRQRHVRVAGLALLDEPRVLGEAGDVEDELLVALARDRGDLADVLRATPAGRRPRCS